jgi:hypothetical protein
MHNFLVVGYNGISNLVLVGMLDSMQNLICYYEMHTGNELGIYVLLQTRMYFYDNPSA